MKKQLFSLLALLLMVAGSAVAQNENSVNAREFTRTASGSWVLDSMPAFNGVLQVTFREPYRLDSIPQGWQVLVGGVDKTAQVTAYTAEEGPATMGWLNILEGDTVMLVPPTAVKPNVKNVDLIELPPATIVTAPTATTGDIYAGTTTPLVTAGTAEGGTMMYKVTTENTQPTSYAGFTATVPTAESLAAGSYYVWYYAKGENMHSNSEMSATAISVTLLNSTSLSQVTGNITVTNGETLTGTLSQPYKITIADGATVTLAGVTIIGVNNFAYRWAGINCEGNATIILKNGTTNTVKGFHESQPGIYVPQNKTLTISGETAGTGQLNASSWGSGAGIGSAYLGSCGNITISGGTVTATSGENGAGIGSGYMGGCGIITISGGTVEAQSGENGAGIGGGFSAGCGNITISGGTVTATGGSNAAGIGSGYSGSCSNITINGGTVTATGGNAAAGIGNGYDSSCGDITITSGVTQVTATKGNGAFNSIGKSFQWDEYNGTVTIGGVVGAISTSPYTYQP